MKERISIDPETNCFRFDHLTTEECSLLREVLILVDKGMCTDDIEIMILEVENV